MENKRKIKIKESIDTHKYKKASNEFYDEIKEMMIKNYLANNFITKEEAEETTLMDCVQLMPLVKPEERGCYLFLRGIFFGAEMTEKERVWKILKNYKNITKVFEMNNK